MSMTYVIKNFDWENMTISFKVSKNFISKTVEVTFKSTEDMERYEGVNPGCHYVDVNGDIVAIKEASNRVVVIRDGESFIKANQWQYDKWMSRLFPDTINSRVYNTLCTNVSCVSTSTV